MISPLKVKAVPHEMPKPFEEEIPHSPNTRFRADTQGEKHAQHYIYNLSQPVAS